MKTTELYRAYEKLLNDFRNNRIGYSAFIETSLNLHRQSVKEALESVRLDSEKRKNDFDPYEFIGYNYAKKELDNKINKKLDETTN